jgi:outer membrane lipoprotein-sorting protein
MRRVLSFLVFFALLFVAAPAFAAFDDAQKADLKRISDYLNGISTAQGRFVQLGPDGKSEQGTFYLRKPGRMRFEYDRPNPNLIVADGSTVAVSNTALKTTDRYPLVDSPLRLLLSEKVDLGTDRRVSAVRREAGTLVVTARQNTGPARGQITLFFADTGSALELRQWEILDAQGLKTVVAVNNLTSGVELSPRLFVIQELSPFQRR